MIKFGKDFVILDPELEPIEFWPYTTHVTDRLIEMEYSAGDRIEQLQKDLLKMFQDAGFNCALDNKIAFGLRDNEGRKYYFGFKDWQFHVGRDYRTDAHNQMRKQKKEMSGESNRSG